MKAHFDETRVYLQPENGDEARQCQSMVAVDGGLRAWITDDGPFDGTDLRDPLKTDARRILVVSWVTAR